MPKHKKPNRKRSNRRAKRNPALRQSTTHSEPEVYPVSITQEQIDFLTGKLLAQRADMRELGEGLMGLSIGSALNIGEEFLAGRLSLSFQTLKNGTSHAVILKNMSIPSLSSPVCERVQQHVLPQKALDWITRVRAGATVEPIDFILGAREEVSGIVDARSGRSATVQTARGEALMDMKQPTDGWPVLRPRGTPTVEAVGPGSQPGSYAWDEYADLEAFVRYFGNYFVRMVAQMRETMAELTSCGNEPMWIDTNRGTRAEISWQLVARKAQDWSPSLEIYEIEFEQSIRQEHEPAPTFITIKAPVEFVRNERQGHSREKLVIQ